MTGAGLAVLAFADPGAIVVALHGLPGGDSLHGTLVTLGLLTGAVIVGVVLLKLSERRNRNQTHEIPTAAADETSPTNELSHHHHEHESAGIRHDHSHHDHSHHDHSDHGHSHHEQSGLWGRLKGIYHPHSHDAADSFDSALEASHLGVRAVKISLVVLLATAIAQVVIVVWTSSVALLADTIHNFSDALTSVPLWIAFVLGRRAATKSYTFGYRRAEDLSGLFIVALIAFSAVYAGWESVRRLLDPVEVENLGILAVAGVIGFLGNEIVAVYRIRVGRQIGSAALVADGYHARTDGLTSLAVVVGAAGVALGFPAADPIVGLLITVAILAMLRDAGRQVFRRLMDAVDPSLVTKIEEAALGVEGVSNVRRTRARWVGHRLDISLHIEVDEDLSLAEAHDIAMSVRRHMFATVGKLNEVDVHVEPEAAGRVRTTAERREASR